MHKNDPVTQIKVELHHGAQDKNQAATSQKIHALVRSKKNPIRSHSNSGELINDAEVHKNDPVTDEEEFYDSHSGIEEPIDDAEINKSDPVTQIEIKFHHDAQIEKQIATSQKIHALTSRKKNLDGSQNFTYINEGNNDEKIALRDENTFPRNTEQHKPVRLIREGSIERRSHDHGFLIREESEEQSEEQCNESYPNDIKLIFNPP